MLKQKSTIYKLTMLGLPAIENLDDFSVCTHLSKKMLYNFSKHAQHYYKTFTIPKKAGGKRNISQPSRSLKAVQAWILKNILENLKVSSACKGFEKGTNILHNAMPHKGANAIMTLDIDDFFPSIDSRKVCSIFKALGYNPSMAAILASICTFKGALPQGGVCSPKLSNLVCLKLDARLEGYVGNRSIVYTRYADDMSFSSFAPNKVISVLPTIKRIIVDEGFQLNDSKTRIFGPSRSKRVTGLVVNEDCVGIGRKKLREMRAKIHLLCFKTKKNKIPHEVLHLRGWLSFIKGVDKDRWTILMSYIKKLKEKNPDSLVSLLL